MEGLLHQATVRCFVRDAGDLLSFRRFEQGSFELANASERATLMTTMLTDVATALWARCRELDESVSRRVIQPNGFFSARWLIAYDGRAFRLELERVIRRRWLLLIPGYAELPSSYRVIVRIWAESERCLAEILGAVDGMREWA